MNNTISNKVENKEDLVIFILSLVSLMFFTFLFVNGYILKIDITIVGVFQQILTLPIMLGTMVLFGFAIKSIVSKKISLKKYPIWSLLILTTVIIITVGSFFVEGM